MKIRTKNSKNLFSIQIVFNPTLTHTKIHRKWQLGRAKKKKKGKSMRKRKQIGKFVC